jgi:Tfp pilus assembly protein FimV
MPTSKLTLANRVAQLERQLEEMRALIAAQAANSAPVLAKAAAAASGGAVSAPALAPPPAKAAKAAKREQVEEGISPAILAVIAAAVAHFVGTSARVRSARLVHPMGASPWAQQGRVFVQASHNLAMTR